MNKFKSFALCIALCCLGSIHETQAQKLPRFNWGKNVTPPDLSWTQQVGAKRTPKGKCYNAQDFGLPSDTNQLSTRAIQAAIDACSKNGGGRVRIPKGSYRIGAIFLKSNVCLELRKGVRLIACEDINHYPEIRSRIAGIEMVWPSAVINIIDAHNTAIIGKGTIDCRGKVFWDKYWKMRKEYEQKKLRWIVDYDCKRVRGLLVSNGHDITLKDFTLMRTGFWGCQILYSDQCTLDGLLIDNNIGGHGPSTDGIDIDSSTRILIQNCEVDCNDDNICLKAGRDYDGLRVNRPTENIIIRNCIARKGAGLITCGSETSGSIRNILGYNLKAYGTSAALRLKSAINRGGTVENIYMTKVQATEVSDLLSASANWNPAYSYSKLPKEFEGKELPEHWKVMLTPIVPIEKGYPTFQNIIMSQVKASQIKTFLSISGMNTDYPLKDITVSDVKAQVGHAGSIAYTNNLTIQDVSLKMTDKKKIETHDNKNAKIHIKYE